MREHAYAEMHRLEQEHWWYRGTRSMYRLLLQRYAPSSGLILDLGCGTGGNLPLLSEWGTVIGLDASFPALTFASSFETPFLQATAERLPFRDNAFSLMAMLGVIEHVSEDVQVLHEVRRVCRPNGRVLLLTSAFMFLWSQHDEANRHIRRYTARELREKAEKAGFKVQYISYLNFFLFPLAVIVRGIQRLMPQPDDPHMDMFPAPEPFNTALARLLALEGWLMQWTRLPFGVSLIAVLEV
jgi:ubiquinone/menaquinone biosynthesis C-methylase UbiE